MIYEKKEDKEAYIEELLSYANERPRLLSLLYDIDMTPEQLEKGSREYEKMLLIIDAWRANGKFS